MVMIMDYVDKDWKIIWGWKIDCINIGKGVEGCWGFEVDVG